MLGLSVLRDLLICGMILFVHESSNEDSIKRHREITTQLIRTNNYTEKAIEKANQAIMDAKAAVCESKKASKDSNESAIWILRKDILESIERCDYKKSVTPKQYKRILDEFEYYKSIGGNHDVEDRVKEFTVKVLGTNEIRMSNRQDD